MRPVVSIAMALLLIVLVTILGISEDVSERSRVERECHRLGLKFTQDTVWTGSTAGKKYFCR